MIPSSVVTPDPITVAAQRVVEALERADSANGRSRFAVAGGSAVRCLARVRAQLDRGAWSRLSLTWVDERVVPFADPSSNRGAAWRDGALSTEQPVGFEMPLLCDGESVGDALARVSLDFARRFNGGLDVTLLGMGEDGHIASLFPGREVSSGEAVIAHVTDSPKPPSERVTLTLRALATAGTHVLLAQGAAKADAVRRLLRGDENLPAAGLAGVIVITDIGT